MEKFANYVSRAWKELRKCKFPTKKELLKYMGITLLIILGFVIVFFAIDTGILGLQSIIY